MEEKGIFNQIGMGKKPKEGSAQAVDYSGDILNINRRIKVLEENMNNLRRKIVVNEENDLNRYKKNNVELKTIVSDINEVKKEFENLKLGVKEIINELRNSAKKEDVDVLKRYIDLWDPSRFASVEHVEKIIDEKLKEVKP